MPRKPHVNPEGLVSVGTVKSDGQLYFDTPLIPGTQLYDHEGNVIGEAAPITAQRARFAKEHPTGMHVYVRAGDPPGFPTATLATPLTDHAIDQILHAQMGPDGPAIFTRLPHSHPAAVSTVRAILEAYERMLARPRIANASEKLLNRLNMAVEGIENNTLLAGDLHDLIVTCRDGVALELLDNDPAHYGPDALAWMRATAKALGDDLAPTSGPFDLARTITSAIDALRTQGAFPDDLLAEVREAYNAWALYNSLARADYRAVGTEELLVAILRRFDPEFKEVKPDFTPTKFRTLAQEDQTLLQSIPALLELDKAGAMVPHGLGGHARELLTRAHARITELLNQPPTTPPTTTPDPQ